MKIINSESEFDDALRTMQFSSDWEELCPSIGAWHFVRCDGTAHATVNWDRREIVIQGKGQL
jgi:hypothetical protein